LESQSGLGVIARIQGQSTRLPVIGAHPASLASFGPRGRVPHLPEKPMPQLNAPFRVPASVLALLATDRPIFPILAHAGDPAIDQHRARQEELLAANEAILAQVDAERREMNADENRSIDDNSAEFDRLDTEIARRERVLAQGAAMGAPRGRRTAPDAVPGDDDNPAQGRPERPQAMARSQVAQPRAMASVPRVPRVSAAGSGGFRSFGDFAVAVRHAAVRGGQVDNRLIRNAATTAVTQESVGTDGGFAVPPDYRAAITTRLFDQDSLLSRCDVQQTSSNSYTAPVDETTPWGTNGIKAYWESEAASITQSKPKLGEVNLRQHKLAALVAQAAEAAQTADTINARNVVKMLSRLPVRSRANAVWLIHPDAEPQLPLMTLANQPVYLPPGGLSDAPFGRPVIPHQVCATVGDLGDIMLVDFSQYLAVRKAAGVVAQTSIHLWFDQDLTAFKFTFGLAGQPWWAAAQMPRSGANTQSPYVTLAAR
jgi:predicted phage gp36 major capsid-like protein